jgi:ADP-heptose:LPS heptosyltransferase
MNSILVIRLTSLGDVILTTPVIRALRNAYPAAAIDVVVDVRYRDVWNKNPYVRNVFGIEKGQEQGAEFDSYDLIVDVQRNRRSAAIVRAANQASKAAVLRYKKYRIQKLFMVYFKRKSHPLSHIVQRYLEPLREIGIRSDTGGLELWPLPTGQRPDGSARHPKRTRIGIAPGAQHFTKRYPPELMARVVRELVHTHNAEVVTLGGEAEVLLCDQIERESGVRVVRGDGATSLAETTTLLDTLDYVISCDSALVHMAAARSIPVAVIYGGTVPELGFTPYGVSYKVIESADVACRPCSHIGRAQCPRGHFRCMESVTPESVVKAALGLQM